MDQQKTREDYWKEFKKCIDMRGVYDIMNRIPESIGRYFVKVEPDGKVSVNCRYIEDTYGSPQSKLEYIYLDLEELYTPDVIVDSTMIEEYDLSTKNVTLNKMLFDFDFDAKFKEGQKITVTFEDENGRTFIYIIDHVDDDYIKLICIVDLRG